MMPLCLLDGDGIATLGGSKSVINRLLMLALYNNLELTLENVNLCDDVWEMLTGLQALGKEYNISDRQLTLYRSETLNNGTLHININASGTTLRFILPYLTFCHMGKTVIHMGERLSQRPIAPLVSCLVSAGGEVKIIGNTIEVIGKCANTLTFTINCKKSSQFLSALLLFRSAYSDTQIVVTDSGESVDYL